MTGKELFSVEEEKYIGDDKQQRTNKEILLWVSVIHHEVVEQHIRMTDDLRWAFKSLFGYFEPKVRREDFEEMHKKIRGR